MSVERELAQGLFERLILEQLLRRPGLDDASSEGAPPIGAVIATVDVAGRAERDVGGNRLHDLGDGQPL